MSTGDGYTPFLNGTSFDRALGREVGAGPQPVAAPMAGWSPFLSVYEGADTDDERPRREAHATIVAELYDEEFSESLFELLTDARHLHQEQLASGRSLDEADALVAQHFAQLTRESEAMIDVIAREFRARDDALVASELDAFMERYTAPTSRNPSFENFFGGLWKKVRSVAGKALSGIAKLGLGPVLNRLKGFIKPLLNRVLQAAIGRLPAAVQPAARQLAQRLGLVKPARSAAPTTPATPAAAAPTEDAGSPVQPSTDANVTELQLEFDEQLAEALLTDDDPVLELEMARAQASASRLGRPVFAELDRARERFVHELATVREGEDATPYIENFVTALLPAIRAAMSLIGRDRVVKFLAGLLGKLVSKLIGPANAPALSRAIVDAGLKLMSLERADDPQLATSAVAATVEETVSRIASLPDHVLDDQTLLEGFVLEAFEQAAAANLPALFSKATYRRRPDLLQAGLNAAWVPFPRRWPRYKRCSRTFRVTLTPHMTEAIQSFDDAPLSEYLQDQLGIREGEDVETEVQLYELMPGGTAADIVRGERESPELGTVDDAALAQLHVLTHEAAAMLLGKPALGRRLYPGSDVRTAVSGQRLYRLAIQGRGPLTVPAPGGRHRIRRLVRINVTLDVPRNQIRVCIFLSEVKAQKLAVRLRQQAHVGSLTVGFQKLIARRLLNILLGQRGQRLRVVQGNVPAGSAVGRRPPSVSRGFAAAMEGWLVQGFADLVKTNAQSFVAAAEDPSDGVTLVCTIDQPPGLQGLVVADRTGASFTTPDAPPTIRVEARPGFRCG